MTADDPRQELRLLTASLRGYLEDLRRAGTAAVPRAPSQPATVAAREQSAAPATAEGDDLPPQAARPVLDQVRAVLGDCQRCGLASTRRNIVFGVGAADAPLMFIGEAPGADEDRQGEPFVGKAGKLLDRMIAAMGWDRESVYIANVLKCRPPQNRDPKPDEVTACEPFLAQQIRAIAPRIIVTLGKPAAHLVLRTSAPISALRGRFHSYQGITVMPTFHPAYLLRSPERKRDTWEDLKKVIAELGRLGVRSPHSPKV